MDIGNTIRCYTVEPLHDPVRRPRTVQQPAAPAFEPAFALGNKHGDYDGDHALTSFLSPGFAHRLGG